MMPRIGAAALRERIEELEEEVRQLRAAIQADSAVLPAPLHAITSREAQVLRLLLRHRGLSQATYMSIRDVETRGWGGSTKCLHVYVCKLRKKLRSLGITIETYYAVGYVLPPRDKDRLRAMIEG